MKCVLDLRRTKHGERVENGSGQFLLWKGQEHQLHFSIRELAGQKGEAWLKSIPHLIPTVTEALLGRDSCCSTKAY